MSVSTAKPKPPRAQEIDPVSQWQSPDYDPTMAGLIAQAEEDWGDVAENRENLVKYGINHLDMALWGIDTLAGELTMVLGAEKNRKTTFMLNILANIQTQTRLDIRPYIDIDTLESGMPPKRFRDFTITLMASRHLISTGHVPVSHGNCPVCYGVCRELHLSPDALRYIDRTPAQQEAIEVAMANMMTWKTNIYGANPNHGSTRNLELSVGKRWQYLHNEYGVNMFITDHVQQYRFEEGTTDYEKQMRAVQRIGDFVAETNSVVFMLSQVSLWSLRERPQGGQLSASGGRKGQQEANNVFATAYEDNSGYITISIEESRKSGSMTFMQRLDDESGAFFGDSISMSEFNNGDSKLASANDKDLTQGKAF